MQTPTPSPADPILAVSLAQLAELERFGRTVLAGTQASVYRNLAWQASRLYAALYVLQSDGVQGADIVDIAALEDAGALFQRLADVARGAV